MPSSLGRAVPALGVGPQALAVPSSGRGCLANQGQGCLQPLQWLLPNPWTPLSCSSHIPGEGRAVLHCSSLQQPQVTFWQEYSRVFSVFPVWTSHFYCPVADAIGYENYYSREPSRRSSSPTQSCGMMKKWVATCSSQNGHFPTSTAVHDDKTRPGKLLLPLW